jgi:hypothetical protein
MAEKANTGFVIPDAASQSQQPGQAASPPIVGGATLDSNGKLTITGEGLVEVPLGPQPRDYAIAAGILLVLLVAFFFAKNAYANHLAGRRVPPGAATAAGWWLFIFLASLATASVLAILSSVKFLTPLFMGPLGVISLVALVLMFVSGKRS